MKKNKIKTVICKECNGLGENIDESDPWCGPQIIECEKCNGIGTIEILNSDNFILEIDSLVL